MNKQTNPRESRPLRDVLENDLCIACGACVYACPASVITPTYHEERGAYEVTITDTNPCAGCPAPCVQVCPSIEVNFAALASAETEGTTCTREGPIRETWLGYSPAFQHNGVSSSGGIIRALIHDSLERGRPVVCLCKDGDGYAPTLLHQPEELDRVPGSIYHAVSFVKIVEVLREASEAVLLISTPCQLEGLYKYIQVTEPTLREKIALVVGLICGWMYTNHALHAFASYKQLGEPVINAQYRGEDKVGRLKLFTEQAKHSYDRRAFDNKSDYYDFRASFSSMANRLRCRLCENHLNVLADIAVGDAWLKRHPEEKLSIIVVRTRTGSDLMNHLQDAGKVQLTIAEATDLSESQSNNLVFGYEARQLNHKLSRKGVATPTFTFAGQDPPPPRAGRLLHVLYDLEFHLRKVLRSGRYQTYRNWYPVYAKFKVILNKLGKLAR
jgi:coenzyme F420-reducing hydrogenase beta subunit